jgi:CO/xanthine dehydrogenase FAD-binding subunit
MPSYARPTRIDDALAMLARGERTILAGGTDFYPSRVGIAPRDDVVDVTALADLRGIKERAKGWRFGAATTWADVIEAKLPPLFDGLKLAAREVGGMQIQNSGTIAGNLCNASPAADGVPRSSPSMPCRDRGRRFAAHASRWSNSFSGRAGLALRAGELVTAVFVPRPAHPRAAIS